MTVKPPSIAAPKNHSWVETEDGSWTIFSEKFQEAAHSTHGAIAETKLRFIEGCELKKKYQSINANLRIFEIGYGLGIGALESFSLWYQCQSTTKVEFISCEIDENLIIWSINNAHLLFENHYEKIIYELISSLKLDITRKFYQSNFQNLFFLKIFVGNITEHQDEILKLYAQKIDCIFQDAYSPKKNPDLWTSSWFDFLKRTCHQEAILSTYSSSASVRKNLIQAGFGIFNGPSFGKKKSSTIAYANGKGDPLIHKAIQ